MRHQHVMILLSSVAAAAIGTPATAQTTVTASNPVPGSQAEQAEAEATTANAPQTEPTGAPTTDQAPADTGDIVVTAQKRAESVQRVPISIAAFSGAQLKTSGVETVGNLTRVTPSFTTTKQSQIAAVRLNIRGVGASSATAVEPSVATFLDDIYVPRSGSLIGRFYDIESVEVLRGPQGTLFGRNASVGAVSIHTAKPVDRFEASASAQAASFDSYDVTGMINAPLSDWAALRVAGTASTYGGFEKTTVGRGGTFGDVDSYGGRASLRLKPTTNITWLIRGDVLANTGSGAAVNAYKPDTVTPAAAAALTTRLGGIVPDFYTPFDRRSNNFVEGYDLDDRQFGLSSDFTYAFDGGLSLRLVNAYRDWRNDQAENDFTMTPVDLLTRRGYFRSKSQTHELQLISPTDRYLGGRLDFVGGLYYFHERFGLGETLDFTDAFCNQIVSGLNASLRAPCLSTPQRGATVNNFIQTLDSYAAYLQATFAISDRIDVVLGGRYTRDEKTGRFTQALNNGAGRLLRAVEDTPLSFKDGRFTWRANLSYRPVDDVMLFANYSTGFKSGGFNSAGGTAALGTRRVFASETVQDYEAGVKSTFAGGAIVLNATAFRMDIDDYQDRSFDGTTTTVRNVGALRQQGVEADTVIRPVRGLRINAAVAYLDSKFLSYRNAAGLPGFGGTQDLTGARNNFSPEWQGSVGAQYDFDLGASGFKLAPRGDVSFISSSSLNSETNNNPQAIQSGYALVGARLTLTAPDDRWTLSVFGDNIFDKGYCTYIFPQVLDSDVPPIQWTPLLSL